MKKVIIGFVYYADALLVQFIQAVLLALTGNLNFPTPQPTLPTITTALEEFQDAISTAEMGGATEKAIRDQKRGAVILLMRQLAAYIQLASGGDEAKIRSAGFDVNKKPSPIGPLQKPNKFIAAPYQKGMLKLSLERINGSKNYLYQYRVVTESEWQQVVDTKTRIILTGLESGKEYVCRVLPCGASDIKVYSDEVNSFVM